MLVASTTNKDVSAIRSYSENLFAPFFIPTVAPQGGFQKQAKVELHFGMVDSGAMVGAMHHCMLDLFPGLGKFFVP